MKKKRAFSKNATDFETAAAKLIKDAGRGHQLSAEERRKLRRIVSTPSPDAPEGFVLRMSELARMVRVHVNTVKQWTGDPGFPERIPGIGWNVAAARKFFVDRGTIAGAKTAKTAEAEAAKAMAEARKETARASLLEATLAEKTGGLVLASHVAEVFGRLATEALARLRPVGENVVMDLKLSPDVAQAVRAKVNAENRLAISKLAELPWLPRDVKKKLLAHGSNFPGSLPQQFAPPRESPPAVGLNQTLNLTEQTLSPDLSD